VGAYMNAACYTVQEGCQVTALHKSMCPCHPLSECTHYKSCQSACQKDQAEHTLARLQCAARR